MGITASDSVTKFLNAVSDLALSMQQLNSTNDMLNLEIDGERYTSTGQSFQTVVNCLDGQGRNTYFCGECFILYYYSRFYLIKGAILQSIRS